MRFVSCTYEEHGAAIRDIFNDAIATSTVLYEYEPRSDAVIRAWFEEKAHLGHPVIGLVGESGLEGFATYGPYRTKPAYKYTVEHSVYVDRRFWGKGNGRQLLRAIVAEATKAEFRTVVAAIDSENASSIHLHVTEGFTMVGRIHQAGYKFGRWLDAVFYQKLLPGPTNPTED